MLQSFCQYITENNLFHPGEKILLAVSGGLDSVVMTHLFKNAGFTFGIAHCNFKLRGEESDMDETFVRELADSFGIPFFRTEFKTLEFAESGKISIQMAARELRYEWFNEILLREDYQYVATAHHLNDALESVLMNISKGMDIYGMTGIRVKTGKIIRPLLFVSRENLLAYAQEQQLSWREDSSNESVKYQRNLVRHEVVPVLKKLNSSLEDTFGEGLEKMRAAISIYRASIESSINRISIREGEDLRIDLPKLSEEQEPLLLLFEILREYGFNYQECKNLFRSEQTGKHIVTEKFIALRDRDTIIVTRKDISDAIIHLVYQDTKELNLSGIQFTFSIETVGDYDISRDKDIASLDYDKLEFPLKIRSWKEGDWFLPLGLGKKKKISDFLIDEKVPLSLKNRVKVLISGDSIGWVIGFRIDERFKITPSTSRILRVSKEKS